MKKPIIAISLVLLSLSAQAQSQADTTSAINRTVLVESVYNPVLSSSEKRSFLPVEQQPKADRQPVVYADEVQSGIRLTRQPLMPSPLTLVSDTLRPGYLRLSYGNYNHLDEAALYRWQAGSHDVLDLGATMTGWNGKLPYSGLGILTDDEDSWSGHRNDLDLHGGWAHDGSTRINVGFDYGRYDRSYLAVSAPLVSGSNHQTNHWYGASAALSGSLGSFGSSIPADYGIRAGLHQWRGDNWLGMAIPYTETHTNIGLDFSYRLAGRGRIDVSLDNDLLSYTHLLDYHNYNSTSLTPRWVCEGRKWSSSLGFNVDVQNTGIHTFQLSPECRFALAPFGFMRLELTVDGGRDLQTFRDLYVISPWWASSEPLPKAYTYVNTQLNVDARLAEGLHAGVRGGWRNTDNALFVISTAENGNLYAGLVGSDACVWNMGGHLTYAWKDAFSMGMDFTWNGWQDVADEALLAFAPQMIWDANVKTRIIDRLYAKADFRFVQRCAVQGERVPSVADLGIMVDYAFNSRLSIYAQGCNLLAQTFSLTPVYPSEGIRGLAGVVLKF